MEDNVELNKKVVRGPDWTHEDQDGGIGGVGLIVAHCEEDHVEVKWLKTGCKHDYSVGDEEVFDLYYAGNSTMSVFSSFYSFHVRRLKNCMTFEKPFDISIYCEMPQVHRFITSEARTCQREHVKMLQAAFIHVQ